MKIEFSFNSSYKGKLTIDGVDLEIVMRPGITELISPAGIRLDETLGGIIASELYDAFADCMQAWASAIEIDGESETWTQLSDAAAEAAADCF